MKMRDTVALVTGASRGAGRAIALELGAAGATVYVTGRSVDGGPTTDNVPGTIDETAREVSGRGGRGIAVGCDHTVDPDVESLFARIRADHGRLDLLVNNVWGGYENSECRPLPMVPFWEQSLDQWDRMFTAGVRAHLTASRLAVPLMLPHPAGSSSAPRRISSRSGICGTSFTTWRRTRFAAWRGRWLKAAGARHRVAGGGARFHAHRGALSRPSAARARSRPSMARADRRKRPFTSAIVALASDERVMEKSGQLLEVGTLAREYGFTDADGSQPQPFRISS